jgi:hypothetical protein
MKGRSCPIFRDNLRLGRELGQAGRKLRRNFEICEQCQDADACQPHEVFSRALAEAVRLAAAEISGQAEDQP